MALFYPKWSNPESKIDFIPRRRVGLFSKPTDPNLDENGLMKLPEVSALQAPQESPTTELSAKEVTAENKPSLKQRLFGYSESGGSDEFGLEKPGKSHEGIFSKVLSYALPTLTGLAGGAGVLPGLATAFFGNRGTEARENAARQAEYNKERAALQKDLSPTASQKDFEYYSKLPADQQEAYLKLKNAGGTNPLALARFDYQMGRDQFQDAEKRRLEDEKRRHQEMALEVPGYERTGEVKITETDASKLRDSVAKLQEFEKGINDLKGMYKKYGNVELTGESSGKLKALHTGIQMTLKNLQELGALSGPDMGLLLNQLGEINSAGNFFTRNSTSAAQAQQVLDNIKNTVSSKLSASGYRPKSQQSSQVDEVKKWIKENPNDPRAAAAVQKLIQMGAM